MKKIYCKIALLLMSAMTVLLAVLIGEMFINSMTAHGTYLTEILQDVKARAEDAEKYALLSNWTEKERMQSVLQHTPTDYQTMIVSIDKRTGKTIAMTANNQTEIQAEEQLSKEQQLHYLHERADRGWMIVRAEKAKYLIQISMQEDMFLVVLRDISTLIQQMIHQALFTCFAAALICLLVIGTLYRLLQDCLFRDLHLLNAQMQKILIGQYDTPLKHCRLKELEQTAEGVRLLKDGYIHKDERLNRLFDSISPYLAAFECLPMASGNFYSAALWKILNIQEKDQLHFQSHPEQFCSFLKELNEQKREDGIVLYQGKHLQIFLHELHEEMIGVIIDRTKEEHAKNVLEYHLAKEKQKHRQDELTCVWNRSAFQEEVERYLAQKKDGTMLLFDLDNFKQINDALGHPQGDQVLCLFAKCLKDLFRQSDRIGRLGGDEFVVFLPVRLSDEVLKAKLEWMMKQIQNVFSPYQEHALSVSVGISQIDQDTGIISYMTLYEGADTALYIAKRLGKNRYYINQEGIRCMVSVCQYCRKQCPRRTILGIG